MAVALAPGLGTMIGWTRIVVTVGLGVKQDGARYRTSLLAAFKAATL